MRLAVFISPHGFGHAARALAVMEALGLRDDARFELFTTVPEVFFRGTLEGRWTLHPVAADVGFRQSSALAIDLVGTVKALDAFRRDTDRTVPELAAGLSTLGCDAVLCDISPLGILAAREAGLPSVLMENFTWDWIYEPLLGEAPGLEDHARWLSEVYGAADLRVQVEPVCRRIPGAPTAPPVARPPLRTREEVRGELGIGPREPVVLLTMGGLGHDFAFLERLKGSPARFLVTALEGVEPPANVVPFRRDEPAYLPDLIAAADLVVTKLGYSTVAEVWLQDRPLRYVANDRFREVGVLREFVEAELDAAELDPGAFDSGAWLEEVEGWAEGAAAFPGAEEGPGTGAPHRTSGAGAVAAVVEEATGRTGAGAAAGRPEPSAADAPRGSGP